MTSGVNSSTKRAKRPLRATARMPFTFHETSRIDFNVTTRTKPPRVAILPEVSSVPGSRRSRNAAVVIVALTVGALGFNACSVINKVRNAVHDIRGNKATIDAFTSKLQSGAPTAFEATYVTTGSAPTTIVYAAQPPNEVAFSDTPSGGSGDTTPVHLVVNASGEFACSQSSGGAWACDKLGTANASSENQILDLYTPAHWVNFLREFSLAAGLAGDKVSSSTMTVNGFTMNLSLIHI